MRLAALTAGAVLLFLAAAAADLGLRSRHALAEARRQEAWAKNPSLKKNYLDARLEAGLAALQKEIAAGKLKPEDAQARRGALLAEHNFDFSESSAKQAYTWYRTAAEDFRSPLNPWSAQAAASLPAAREAWKAELAARGVDPEQLRLH